MSDGELLLELTNEIMGRTAATAARAVLPIIRRRELEAGEKVKEAAVDAVSEGEVWSDVPFSTAIRALDVAAIIGDSHE